MLKSLYLHNFRAFKDQQFDFSRLNIFVGPNNVGKSSILSALNLLAQSVTSLDSGAPLLLSGKYDDLGTYIDVVNGNISRTPLTLSFEVGSHHISVSFKYRTQRREIEITRYELKHEGRSVYLYQKRKDAYDIRYNNIPIENILRTSKKRKPEFRKLLISDDNLLRTRFFIEKQDDIFERKEDMDLVRNIFRQTSRSNRTISETFSAFDSLSPFREPPKRTFLFGGQTPTQIGRTGSHAIDLMVADTFARGSAKTGLIDNVSAFFKKTGMGQRIEVKALTSRHYEVCMISNDGSSHNICDVGFGCSQVLPVLVGGLNSFLGVHDTPRRRRPIFVAQEPEIHLHPNAQAALGSFFVDLAKDHGQLFIETHSDNLILRVQRHVAQGDISPNDVSIFFVHEVDGEKVVDRINLDRAGVFSQEWPGGFFPQRQEESLQLARARPQS